MDCKSIYSGSIPEHAYFFLNKSPSGGIGRHKGLKIPRLNKIMRVRIPPWVFIINNNMSILKILFYPNKILREKSKIVKKYDNILKKNILNMFDTMYKNNGIGLSAIQVNINKSIIIIDILKEKNSKLIFINPKIINKKGYIKSKESCLSIPNKNIIIKRYKYINIKANNILGKKIIFKCKNLLSICIQHEIDHINGKLIIDYNK